VNKICSPNRSREFAFANIAVSLVSAILCWKEQCDFASAEKQDRQDRSKKFHGVEESFATDVISGMTGDHYKQNRVFGGFNVTFW
jgi:hypothetical protein